MPVCVYKHKKQQSHAANRKGGAKETAASISEQIHSVIAA
jgi:hypothetical protein